MKLVEAQINPESISPQMFAQRFKVSILEAMAMARQAASERVFVNDVYQVTMSRAHDPKMEGWPSMIHLSVIRKDGGPIREWRDMQAIKNALVGPENEAIEIYPAESRLVDCGNNYHLWVFEDAGFKIPMGWTQRRVM